MRFLPLLSLLLLSCQSHTALEHSTSASDHPRPRPNIIFIMADDLGYASLGCYGQEMIKTPELDRMARDGMLFRHHYAGSPVCAPSRAILMTGQHSGHTTVRGNANNPDGLGQLPLPAQDITVAEILQQAGYFNSLIGKWGLGNAETSGSPLRQGFDEYYGYLDQILAHNYYPEYLLRNDEKEYLRNEVQYLDPEAWHKGLGSVSTEQIDYSHDLFMNEVLAFLEEDREQPFFLYVPVTIPHDNGEAPKGEWFEVPDLGIYADEPWPRDYRAYASMITRLDRDVGRILRLLETNGMAENTLVVFTSDNGSVPELTEHFNATANLRGYKRDLYEGGIRVPMLAWWPGVIPAGSETDHISAFWDFLPTICDLLGVETPAQVDGISFLPTLLGDDAQPEHNHLYWEFPLTWAGNGNGYQVAVRKGDWKAIRVDLMNDPDAPIELYNLREDPGETRNLADDYPETVTEMESIMRAAHEPSEHFPPVTW